ncbi:hypothetical protein BZA77DRAFT_94699 [Pyronema omphalodes]|nr:hypothetical protein BZA77DRAFT_94699 [Pyronema omphalodes]
MSSDSATTSSSTIFDLEKSLVRSLPKAIFYIPNFISSTEEAQLLREIASQPKPKWTVLTHRRLQTHPSALTKNNVLLAAPLPPWLESIVPRMQQLKIWDNSPHKKPNHVLINEYKPGEGIMPHEDGGAYFGCVATVSLGAPIVLDLYSKHTRADSGEFGEAESGVQKSTRLPKWRILQEPRSLLITTNDMYTDHLHGIQDITADENLNETTIANWTLLGHKEAFSNGRYERQTRTSLTYRDVLKVSNVGKLFGGRK